MSVYALYALAGLPKFFVDFLVPGVCGRSWTISSVGAGAGTGPSSQELAPSGIMLVILSQKWNIYKAKQRFKNLAPKEVWPRPEKVT